MATKVSRAPSSARATWVLGAGHVGAPHAIMLAHKCLALRGRFGVVDWQWPGRYAGEKHHIVLHPVAVPFPRGTLARKSSSSTCHASVASDLPSRLRSRRNQPRLRSHLAPAGPHQHSRDRCRRSEVVRHPRRVPRRRFTEDLREGACDHVAATQHRRELAQPRYRRERKVSVRNELQERVRATRKTDDEEAQSPNSAKRSRVVTSACFKATGTGTLRAKTRRAY